MFQKYILPSVLFLLCLILLLGGAGLFVDFAYFLTNATPAVATPVNSLAVVTLGDDWAIDTFESDDTQAHETAILETLSTVQSLGGNAIALTARLPDGDALFRDSTETLATAEIITAHDSFFTQYHALDTLIAAANSFGMEVLLIPTDASGTELIQTETLPDFITTLVTEYNLRLLTAYDISGDILTYQVTDLTVESGADGNVYTLYNGIRDAVSFALTLQQSEETEQLFLGEYTTLCADSSNLNLFWAYYADGEALPDLTQYLGDDYARTLAVTYPTEDGSEVSDSTIFLMGTSNPDQALTIDGDELPRYGEEGVWGILVDLSYGNNTFTFANGDDTLEYTVVRGYGSSGSSSSSGSAGYYNVAEGQTIIITDAIASALSNAYSASTITQTFYEGAVMEVTRYLSYAGSTTPYAYQLTTGDFVRAAYCELYSTERATLSEATIKFNQETNASVLTLTGGTPAVYHIWEGNTLTLTLLTADYTGSAPSADWFTSTVESDGTNTVFTFTFTEDEPLYGWAVNYDNDTNTTYLSLKQTPQLSDDESLPLSGVRVLLDAGHGLDDLGAMGSAGLDAACEKDANLALTMATAYRLEQLGATVILTRDDDSFPTLQDRVSALNSEHPDFFISIHHNSLELVTDINTASGVEAYWFYDQADTFASDLITAISDETGRNLRSASYGYYYVTRSNICPATLLEVGFMTNPAEYEDLVNIDTIWEEAGAIAQTIYETVKEYES